MTVPLTTGSTKKTVAETVPISNQVSDVPHHRLFFDSNSSDGATATPSTAGGATASVVAPDEIVDAFHTMKESLDRLLICNEKIYFRLFQELNKINDKLEESSTSEHG